MKKNTKKILGITIPITLFIAFLVGIYYLVKNSPLGKALNQILDGGGALAAAIGQQFKTCGKVGYFNVKEGCYVGIGAVIYGVLWVFGTVISYLISRNKNASIVEKTATVRKTSTLDVVNEALDELDLEQITNSNASDEEIVAAIVKSVNNKATESLVKAIKEQSISLEEIKEKIEAAHQQREADNRKAADELSQDQDDNVDNMVDQADGDFVSPE